MDRLWDDFWKKSGRKVGVSHAKKRIEGLIAGHIRPGHTVLDAGCGSGFFSAYLISQGCDVYSLDYSEEALALTKKNTGNRARSYIKGSVLDTGALKPYQNKFDLIFTDGLLEHYSAEEQRAILKNMRRIKKQGGYIMNFVPNRFSLWSAVRPFYMGIKERPFVMSELLELHSRSGLDVVSYGGISVLPVKLSPEKMLGRYIGMLLYCIAV